MIQQSWYTHTLLPPNQQRQSTEGIKVDIQLVQNSQSTWVKKWSTVVVFFGRPRPRVAAPFAAFCKYQTPSPVTISARPYYIQQSSSVHWQFDTSGWLTGRKSGPWKTHKIDTLPLKTGTMRTNYFQFQFWNRWKRIERKLANTG